MSGFTQLELVTEQRDVYLNALAKIAACANMEIEHPEMLYMEGSADAFNLLAAIAQEAIDMFEEQS